MFKQLFHNVILAAITSAIFLTLWNQIKLPLWPWLHGTCELKGIPYILILLILKLFPTIVLFEILGKFLCINVMSNLKFITTHPNEWNDINTDDLEHYSQQLEDLGFVQLMDHTSPQKDGFARLFAHPGHYIFVEVGQVPPSAMFCSLLCYFKQPWSLAVTNLISPRSTIAVGRALMRLPQSLVKRYETKSVKVLLKELLKWRETAIADLSLEINKDMSAERFFEQQQLNRTQQRKALWWRSIIWSMVEMVWFQLNPKSEWLGNYHRVKQRKT